MLESYIDISPLMCTALIIDKYLKGQFYLWAITAAYGDNLTKVANELTASHGLDGKASSALQELGIYLNYNGYGASLDDLFYHPADLYRECVKYRSPLDFIEQSKNVFETLQTGYWQDLASVENAKPFHETESVAALILPNESWARRVSGVFSNKLCNDNPDRAHVILTEKADGDFLVSIRAPLSQLEGADEVASKFKTGGGRRGAAGINALQEDEIALLIDLMQQRYG